MKKIIKGLIILMVILLNVNSINAKTNVITFYSKKEWVTHYDFFDKEFSDATQITNSQGISCNMTGFGPYSFTQTGHGLYPVSYENLNGKRPLVVKATGEHLDFYSTFVLKFGAKIKIHDIDLGVEIKNENGELIDYLVYIENERGKELVYEGHETKIINIKLNDKEVNSIYIRAKVPSNGNIHSLKYFKINRYQIYEHVKWVNEYIPNTETYDKEYKQASGKYYPNDGGGIWKKSHTVLFSPTRQDINDVASKMKLNSWLRYNDGLNIGISKESLPDFENMYMWNGGDRYLTSTFNMTPSNKPFSWKYDGYSYHGIDNKTNSEYIKTGFIVNKRNLYIKVSAIPMHCGGGKCKLASEGGGKVDGHKSYDINNNCYDSYITTYRCEADENHDYIKEIVFTLTLGNGVKVRELKRVSGDNLNNILDKNIYDFEINETGIFRIEAYLKNALGDGVWISSGSFHVDNEKPFVKFNPLEVTMSNKPIDVLVSVDDLHSKLDKWRYALSNDGGKTFGIYSDWICDNSKSITLVEPGDNVIKVNAIDNVGNACEEVSKFYKIAQQPPELILKDNCYFVDEVVNKENLKDNAIAIDPVDGDIKEMVKIEKIEYEDKTIVNKPDKLDTSKSQIAKITYSVTNSAQIKVEKTKDYPILDSGSSLLETNKNNVIYSRYISEKYLNSLKDSSIWNVNKDYKRILMESLMKNTGDIYKVN